MDSSNIDPSTLVQLNQLLSNSPEGGQLFDLEPLISAVQPYIITLLIISIVASILYIFHLIQRIRVNHAILESRDILREMNNRQKGASSIPAQKPSAQSPVQKQPEVA